MEANPGVIAEEHVFFQGRRGLVGRRTGLAGQVSDLGPIIVNITGTNTRPPAEGLHARRPAELLVTIAIAFQDFSPRQADSFHVGIILLR
jgi:hypothetical protein